jgi:hypothetical protein
MTDAASDTSDARPGAWFPDTSALVTLACIRPRG